MKSHKLAFGALALAVTLAVQSHAQIAAPTSLPSCLIQYSLKGLGSSTSLLVLYNPDNTYVQMFSYTAGFSGVPPTQSAHRGMFTYAVDPQNAVHATIVYDGGAAFDELYFRTTTSGTQVVPPVLNTAGPIPAFTLYPRQATNGACNISNLCKLATGGTATSGFVNQSVGPRWVLLRAVGISLGNFGVSPTVASPSLTLYDSTQAVVGMSAAWSSDPNLVGGYETAFSIVGAFPLNSGSDEGALLVPLNPGAYTAQFKASNAGTILCEVYILPF